MENIVLRLDEPFRSVGDIYRVCDEKSYVNTVRALFSLGYDFVDLNTGEVIKGQDCFSFWNVFRDETCIVLHDDCSLTITPYSEVHNHKVEPTPYVDGLAEVQVNDLYKDDEYYYLVTEIRPSLGLAKVLIFAIGKPSCCSDTISLFELLFMNKVDIKDGDCFKVGKIYRVGDKYLKCTRTAHNGLYGDFDKISTDYWGKQTMIYQDEIYEVTPFKWHTVVEKGDIIEVENALYQVSIFGSEYMLACDVNGTYRTFVEELPFTIREVQNPNYDQGARVIEDEERLDKITHECIRIFTRHGYDDATYDGVRMIVDTWNIAKGSLAKILRKHPNWDEENLCVTKICTETRNPKYFYDDKKFQAFRSYVNGYKNNLLFNLIQSRGFEDGVKNGGATDAFCKQVSNSCERGGIIVSCHKGQKVSRVIRAICDAIGITSKYDFERYFAGFADAIATGTADRRFTLSINIKDYLLMSNGNSWSSCHYLDCWDDSKCYQSGTISYACDYVSTVFSAIDKNRTEEYSTAKKIRRQMFFYYKGALLQSRLYPTFQDVEFSAVSLEFVKDIFVKCDEIEPFDYKTMDVYEFGKYFRKSDTATNYPDFDYSEYNCLLTVSPSHKLLFTVPEIGSRAICPTCGCEHDLSYCCYCEDCKYENGRSDDDYDDYDQDGNDEMPW